MKSRIIKRAGIGFAAGIVVGYGISFLTAENHGWINETLLLKTGSTVWAWVIQGLLSGLLGGISMAGTVFYEFETWGMTKAAILHYLLIIAAYFPIAFFCGWIRWILTDILVMAGIQALIYFLIWLFMYIRYRRQADQLNELVTKKRD